MINIIPFFGWLISLGINASLAVPFWFFWTVCGLGEKYFYWLPPVYLHIGFLDCIGVFTIIAVLRVVILPGAFAIKPKAKEK